MTQHAWLGRVAALALVAGFAGCTSDQIVMRTGLPGASAGATLELLAERGDYLDVVMASGGLRYRFFLPDDESCRALFISEQPVSYANAGPFGRLAAGTAECDPVGILSLVEWRDRGPHHQAAAVIPRDQVLLRERVYDDAQLTLIRGSYSLASLIGIMGVEDLLAVIPNTPECQGLSVPGSASMEFRPAGKRAYTLVNGGALCSVLGFVRPGPTPVP